VVFFGVMALFFVQTLLGGARRIITQDGGRSRKAHLEASCRTGLTIFAAHGLQPEFLSGLS
jgi:hypothetical protein